MKILITGSNGQLGLTLKDVFAEDDLILTDREELDITDTKAVNNFVDKNKPEVVINAAAFTAVDQAEIDKELARKINVDGAANLATAAKKIDALFFQISTDFVFDGKKTIPYVETDKPHPLSVYGQTKYDGELAVKKIGGKYYILRTAWLYSPYGKNFVKTIMKLGQEKDQLKVVSDQIGCPTYTYDLANVIKTIIERGYGFFECRRRVSHSNSNHPLNLKANEAGLEWVAGEKVMPSLKEFPYNLYHYSGDGSCSWFEFAKEIVKLSGGKARVLPQTSAEFAASREGITAARPAYSVLDCRKIKSLGTKTIPWQESLAKCINILKENIEL